MDHETQLSRLSLRNSFTPDEASARIAAQASRQDRLAAADVVIDNRGTPAQLRKQVADVWSDLPRGGSGN